MYAALDASAFAVATPRRATQLTQDDAWVGAVEVLRAARPALDVAWRVTDPGETQRPGAP
jgi:hypothetical protein